MQLTVGVQPIWFAPYPIRSAFPGTPSKTLCGCFPSGYTARTEEGRMQAREAYGE